MSTEWYHFPLPIINTQKIYSRAKNERIVKNGKEYMLYTRKMSSRKMVFQIIHLM